MIKKSRESNSYWNSFTENVLGISRTIFAEKEEWLWSKSQSVSRGNKSHYTLITSKTCQVATIWVNKCVHRNEDRIFIPFVILTFKFGSQLKLQEKSRFSIEREFRNTETTNFVQFCVTLMRWTIIKYMTLNIIMIYHKNQDKAHSWQNWNNTF